MAILHWRDCIVLFLIALTMCSTYLLHGRIGQNAPRKRIKRAALRPKDVPTTPIEIAVPTFAVAIPTRDRIGYVQLTSSALRGTFPSEDVWIFDDQSTEYSTAELQRWYGTAHVWQSATHLKADAMSRHILEWFLTSTYDVLVLMDSDLIVAPTWLSALRTGLREASGLLSLYRSGAPQHRSLSCGDVLCRQPSMGNAGTVWRRALAARMLSEVSARDGGFDWSWSEWCTAQKVPMEALKASAVLHIGMHGSWSHESSAEKSIGFPMDELSAGVQKQARHFLAGKRPKKVSAVHGIHINGGTTRIACDVPCFWPSSLSGIVSGFRIDELGVSMLMSMEGEEYYPSLKLSNRRKDHFIASTRMNSDIPMPYFNWPWTLYMDKTPSGDDIWSKNSIQTPHVPLTRVKRAAVFIARNCHSKSNRERWVKQLMQRMPVESVSSCLHNTDMANRKDKLDMMKQYAMYFAFENQRVDDYITEKLWNTFRAGVLPVYFGAPNIREHVPEHSIVNVDDFESVDELAKHLKEIMENEELYNSYHAWRYKPLPEWFVRKYNFTHVHSRCRTCRWASAKLRGLDWDAEQQQVVHEPSPGARLRHQPIPVFTPFAPQHSLLWSRGWYMLGRPSSVPLDYYNHKGLDPKAHAFPLQNYFQHACGTVWVRTRDLSWWARHVVPVLRCDIILVSSDGVEDVPDAIPSAAQILDSPRVTAWYAQNVVDETRYPKLWGLPLGLAIHDGFPGSPDSQHTIDTMQSIRLETRPFRARHHKVLYDPGTFNPGGGSRRDQARIQARDALGACASIEPFGPHLPRTSTWRRYGEFSFAVAPTGMGYDTHRFWELLYFGVVPIVKSGPLDAMIRATRIPAIIVQEWSEVCKWSSADLDSMARDYEPWINTVPQMLQPQHWVPRNQTMFDQMCMQSATCRQVAGLADTPEPAQIATSIIVADTPEPAQIATSIILGGVAKSISVAQVEAIVPKLRRLGNLFQRYHIVVYENDSPPESRAAWRRMLNHTDSTFVSEDWASTSASRPERIATARNRFLEIVHQRHADYTYLLVTDLDGVCGGTNPQYTYSEAVFREAFRRSDEWDVLSFRFKPYWDRWAFRHKEQMPYNMYGRHRALNPIQTPAQMDNWVESQDSQRMIEVESAFMMLALYRMSHTVRSKYSGVDEAGDPDCEHVAFHRAMRQTHHSRIRLWPRVYCENDPGFVQNAAETKTTPVLWVIPAFKRAWSLDLVLKSLASQNHILVSKDADSSAIDAVLKQYHAEVIEHPWSCSRHPKQFPAQDESLNANYKGDTYGNPRSSWATCLKHHWWWMMKQAWARKPERVCVLEDDTVIHPQAFEWLAGQEGNLKLTPDEIAVPWCMTAKEWSAIDPKAFCEHDDYNWDQTIAWMKEKAHHNTATVPSTALSMHVGDCGGWDAGGRAQTCTVEKIAAIRQRVSKWRATSLTTTSLHKKWLTAHTKPNGGWGHPKDWSHCLGQVRQDTCLQWSDDAGGCQHHAASDAWLCTFEWMSMDTSGVHVSKGGADIGSVLNRRESEESVQLDHAAIGVPYVPRGPTKWHHQKLISAATTNKHKCDQTFRGTTLFFERIEYANLWHTMNDWFNVHWTLETLGNPSDVTIVWLDGHAWGHLDAAWGEIFSARTTYVSEYSGHVCFEKAVWVPKNTPIWNTDVPSGDCDIMDRFVRRVLTAYGVVPSLTNDVVIDRQDYMAHPRHKSDTKNNRMIEHLDQMFPTSTVVQLETLTFKEQVQLIASAKRLRGVHGAGLTHLLWLPDGAQVVEWVAPSHASVRLFEHIATWRPNIRYARAEMPNPDTFLAERRRQPADAEKAIQTADLFAAIDYNAPENSGPWKQGWDYGYDGRFKDGLTVHVVPHSHNDPGWIKTYHTYYSTQTRHILDTVVAALTEDPRRTFIWAEISYFSLWWGDATQQQKEQARKLVAEKRLDFVTGGWVMNDEASVTARATRWHLQEGREWLQHTFGITPQYSWAIDPFGHSAGQAQVLKELGYKGMLIQRVHYAVKKQLAQKQQLEFQWQTPAGEIFTHMMPFYSYDGPHTCGPDPSVCCQFDFARIGGYGGCPWHKPAVPITSRNVAERSTKWLDQVYKKAMLYRGKHVLIPVGDDFRYQTLDEAHKQFVNYQKMFDWIQANVPAVKVSFSTLSRYFDAVRETNVPRLVGSFFPYADREQDYWTGYFNSRIFYKGYDRLLESLIAAAETKCPTVDIHLQKRALGLFQHHDGITGTAKSAVVQDYYQTMQNAVSKLQSKLKTCLAASLTSRVFVNPLSVETPTMKASEIRPYQEDTCEPATDLQLDDIKLDEHGRLLHINDTPVHESLVWRSNTPGPGKAGAYLMSVTSKEDVLQAKSWTTCVAKKYRQVETVFDMLKRRIRVYNDGTIEFIYAVDIHARNNGELWAVYKPEWSAGRLCSDVHGLTWECHVERKDAPLQAKFWPMPTMAWLASSSERLTFTGAQPTGVGFHEGAMVLMLDRRGDQDDWRGLGQGVTDSRPVEMRFGVLMETESLKEKASEKALSIRNWMLNPEFEIT